MATAQGEQNPEFTNSCAEVAALNRSSSRSYLSSFSSLAVAAWLFIAVGVAFYSGEDWGRYISILGVGFFLLQYLIEEVDIQYIARPKRSNRNRLHSRRIQRASASATVLSLLILCIAALTSIWTQLPASATKLLHDCWPQRPQR